MSTDKQGRGQRETGLKQGKANTRNRSRSSIVLASTSASASSGDKNDRSLSICVAGEGQEIRWGAMCGRRHCQRSSGKAR